MSHYRIIQTRIWNDEKFHGLTKDGKLAFFFLLTHPGMTSLGAMRATLPGLAAELSGQGEDLTEGLREVFGKGLANLDEDHHFLCLPNFLRYNKPASCNVIKAWVHSLELLPECESKVLLVQRVASFAKDLPEAFRKAFDKTFPKTYPLTYGKVKPIQEQEQEQEQEYKKKIGRPSAEPSAPAQEEVEKRPPRQDRFALLAGTLREARFSDKGIGRSLKLLKTLNGDPTMVMAAILAAGEKTPPPDTEDEQIRYAAGILRKGSPPDEYQTRAKLLIYKDLDQLPNDVLEGIGDGEPGKTATTVAGNGAKRPGGHAD
jgi:hypothetical protein